VSQNLWIEDNPEHIVALRSINSTTTPVAGPSKKSSGISIGAIVGIIVAAVLTLLLAAVATFFILRRRRKRRKEAEKKDEDEDPFRKPEMDGTGKPPIGELYNEGKLGEVDSSSKVEMQGSQPGISLNDKKNMAEIEGSRGGAEMEGTTGGTEMEGQRLRAEMAGDHLAPVELDAGPQGLTELPSPNTSNSELPSPISSGNERRSGLSATWSRRQKPTPKLPGPESSDISPDAEAPGRRSGAGMWTGRLPRGSPSSLTPNEVSSRSSDSRERRLSQPSPNPIPSPRSDNRHLRPSPRNTGLEIPSRSTTPNDVSSQSSGSRERQQTRDNVPDRHSPGLRDDSREMVDMRRPSPLGNNQRSATAETRPPPRGTPRDEKPLPPSNFF